MLLLVLSLMALLLGPVAYRAARSEHGLLDAVDGFVLVAITGMVVFAILPEAVATGGTTALVMALIGAMGPALAERAYRAAAHSSHNLALVLGLVGLGFHGVLDGAALAEGAWQGSGVLPWAVVLHRFPAGLAIWWLLRPGFGLRVASATLALVMAATVAGFAAGPPLLTMSSPAALGWFQGLVGGALVHVVVHRTQPPSSRERSARLEGFGALAGILLLVLMFSRGVEHGHEIAGGVGSTFLALALESAPALAIAYAVAGFMSVMLPRSSVMWMKRGTEFTQALKGMTIGLPLPICSCGVVPLYRTLVVRGAPPAAAMAFLVATPELGLDAIFLSIPLLGVEMTVIRVVGAVVVALTVGWLVARIMGRTLEVAQSAEPAPGQRAPGSWLVRARNSLRIGFGEVVDHTAPWIVLGLAVAALAAPLVTQGQLGRIPAGLDVLVFAVLGMPIYVCAAAATPLVAVFLAGAVSPGAALAFLMTGPATNVTTFGVLTQLHGRRTALVFSATIIGLALVLGLVVNAVIPQVHGISLSQLDPEQASPLQIASLVILGLAVLGSIFRRGGRAFLREISFQMGTPAHRH